MAVPVTPSSKLPEPPEERGSVASEGPTSAQSYAVACVMLLACVAGVVLPGLLDARVPANEAAAISALVSAFRFQEQYREGDADADGVANCAGSMSELFRAFGTGTGSHMTLQNSPMNQGYRFLYTTDDLRLWFQIRATPIEPGKTGNRSFFVDDTGVVCEVAGGTLQPLVRLVRVRPQRPDGPVSSSTDRGRIEGPD